MSPLAGCSQQRTLDVVVVGFFFFFAGALAMLMPILFQTLQVRIGMQNAAMALCLGGVFAIAGALYFPSEKKTA